MANKRAYRIFGFACMSYRVIIHMRSQKRKKYERTRFGNIKTSGKSCYKSQRVLAELSGCSLGKV